MYVFLHSRHANGVGELSTNLTQTHNAELDRLVDAGLQEPDFDARKAIYDDMARELNREGVNVWLFHTPFALIADPEVHGLNPARELGFAGLEPKPWIGGLWLDQP
jgi:ABC-type transport system substrate-binding protein